jgi:hypothetical protein
MEFEIGQEFSKKYPPELAGWCDRNNARIVRNGSDGWRVEGIPAPAEEDRKALKSKEIREALDAFDWRSMREHDRAAADPAYQIDPTIFEYKEFLRNFDQSDNWWNAEVPGYEEFIRQKNLEGE